MEIDESDASSSLDIDFEEMTAMSDYREPHQFEPDASSESDEEPVVEEEEEIQNNRLRTRDWCQCENCQIMDYARECVCCKEVAAIVTINIDIPAGHAMPTCITQHPGFAAVCLNQWVLKTAWYQYRQQYSEPYEGPEHKRNRHIAYRQLARWCWGFLGRHVRVVLPSCAVACIRAHFPPPGLEEDFQFEGFNYADE